MPQVIATPAPGGGPGGEHPNLAAHDTLGLATQGELDAHEAAADPHTVYQREGEKGLANGYPSLDAGVKVPIAQLPTGTTSTTVALGDAVANHVAAGDPHAAYALDSDLTTHAGAADPHTGYQRESEKGAVSGYASLDGTTKVPIAQLPTGTTSTTVALGDAAAALDATHAGAADPHTGYQRESEKNAASGYAGLDASTLQATAQHGTGTADATTFLRGDRTWATPTGAPTPDARLTTKVMATDQADITGITLVELTELTVASLAAGSYQFCYRIIYQTTATTTGVEFVVDSLATVDRFVSNMYFGSTGGAAATGIADQQGVGTAAGLMEVKSARANNTRPGVTIGVDTANADMLMTIEGVIRTTTTGNLRLMMAAELAALVCRARAGSSLVLIKTS